MRQSQNQGDIRMRRTIVASLAGLVIGGAATGAALSQAQPSPPPVQEMGGAPQPGPERMGGWGHRPGQEAHRWMHRHGGMRRFALIYRQRDRQLAPADVQKIAEAFLLWNGNHTWKVTDVAATPDGPIGFSLATPDGSVIAKFTMDPHSGKIARLG
jgi:hypothetical protein